MGKTKRETKRTSLSGALIAISSPTRSTEGKTKSKTSSSDLPAECAEIRISLFNSVSVSTLELPIYYM